MDVITTHINADFDSLGAMVAALRLYPNAVLAFSGSTERGLHHFMERHSELLPPIIKSADIALEAISRLIIVDCQQSARIGIFADVLANPNLEIHIYDHHPVSADSITPCKGLVARSGSTSTLLTQLLMEKGIHLSPSDATLVLLGIHEDTGRMLFSETTPQDYRSAAWLLEHGADLAVISETLSPGLSRAQADLLKLLLKNMKNLNINGLTVTIAYADSAIYVDDISVLSHLFGSAESFDALFMVVEMDGGICVVGRSHVATIDVGSILSDMNGGGHSAAASAMIHGQPLREVLQLLEQALYRATFVAVTAGSIMSTPVLSAADSLDLSAVEKLMLRYGCSTIPVVSESGVVGVISKKTVEKAIHHGLGNSPVSDFMSTDFFSATVSTPVSEVSTWLVGRGRRMVPVLDNGLLTGVVTRSDVMRYNRHYQPDTKPDNSVFDAAVRTRSLAGLISKKLPPDVVALLQGLGAVGDEAGLSVYLVGGFVRDLLLGELNYDVDVTVEGDGVFYAERCAGKLGGRVKSHAKFGTAVLLLPDGRKVDVASTRLEYYESPGALPVVERASLRHDLHRRDFTINTLAVCLNSDRFGILTDYYGGQQDIHERVVRVLHNLSFVEDPTRMYRAVRFEQRLGFHIARHSEKMLKNAVGLGLPEKLGGERLSNELKRILSEHDPVPAVERLSALGLLTGVHPSVVLDVSTCQLLKEARDTLAWFRLLYLDDRCEQWQVYYLALCNRLDGSKFKEICQRLSLPGRLAEELCVQRHKALVVLKTVKKRIQGSIEMRNSDICVWFDGLNIEILLYLAAKGGNETLHNMVSAYMTRLRHLRTFLSGSDLVEMGIGSGPAVGRLKKRLLSARQNGETHSREDEMSLAGKIVTAAGELNINKI